MWRRLACIKQDLEFLARVGVNDGDPQGCSSQMPGVGFANAAHLAALREGLEHSFVGDGDGRRVLRFTRAGCFRRIGRAARR